MNVSQSWSFEFISARKLMERNFKHREKFLFAVRKNI